MFSDISRTYFLGYTLSSAGLDGVFTLSIDPIILLGQAKMFHVVIHLPSVASHEGAHHLGSNIKIFQMEHRLFTFFRHLPSSPVTR